MDRAKLAQLGLGALTAYAVISNINAAVILSIAWITVVKTQGVMPLAAGMWPKFLAVWSGLWISSNFMRPIRLSLALAVTPVFNAGLDALQRRTGWNKGVVYGFILAGIAIGTLSLLFTILLVAGGFPQGLPAFLAGQR